MKFMDMKDQAFSFARALELAEHEPVVILAANGKSFTLADSDNFDEEIEALRNNLEFQKFLDEQSASPGRVSLESIQRKINAELAAEKAIVVKANLAS